MDFPAFLIFWLPISLVLGAIVGKARGRVGAGMFLSALLGPIGWLVILIGPDYRRKCPFCAETIKPEAIICPHCQREVSVEEYRTWSAKRYAKRLANIEDPVEKWAREQHPDEVEPK
jgi:hypothetical protein